MKKFLVILEMTLVISILPAQEINEFKVFNLTFNTFNPQEVKLNRGRIIWKDQDFGGTLYNLKYFSGQTIFKLDSNLVNFKADINGDYVVWNTAAGEIKLFNVRDWTTVVLDNSYNPSGLQPVSIHNGFVAYSRTSGNGTEIVLKNLNSSSDTTFTPVLWNRQPDVHHGQAAWVGSSSENSANPSDIYFYGGVLTQNLTNTLSEINSDPILKDGQVAWLQDDGVTKRVKLFIGDTTITLAEPANASTKIQGYDLSDGAALAALTDTIGLTSRIIIYDSGQNSFTNIIISDSVAFPHIDNRLAMWVEGRRQFGPQIKAYNLDTQIIEFRPSAYEAVIDDEEFAWTFGEAVELGRPVTYEKITSDAQNGWEQTRFKPLDNGKLVWGNYDNSTNMRLFYNDGVTTTKLADSTEMKDFLMANDNKVIWRENADTLFLYDAINPPQPVLDTIQLENPYIAGGYIGLFGFFVNDPNMVRYPFLYEISSGNLNQLNPNDVNPWTVLCEGNSACWRENNGAAFRFFNGSSTMMLNSSTVDFDYSYRNGIIVWSEQVGGIYQIMMYDVASGITTQLTNSSVHQIKPATDGENVIWFENANFPGTPTDSSMWYYNISSGTSTKIGKSYPGSLDTPWLSNGKTGWYIGGRVFVYDGQSITMLTEEFQKTAGVVVDSEQVVWRRTPNPNFQDNGDIYIDNLHPRVAFDALNITGMAPLTVSFFNRSWQGDQTVLWNFGDGNTSPIENPTHVYQNTGNYSVTLSVSGPTGIVSEKKINLVRVEGISAPIIGITPISHDFGDVAICTSDSQTFEIVNQGGSDLNVTAINISGSDSAEFALVSGNAPFTLAPGDTQFVAVSFTPITTGTKSSNLQIFSDDPNNNVLNVPLTGNGVGSTNYLGDVNGDGMANSTDALITLSFDGGLPIPQPILDRINSGFGDVNSDGLTNSTDALLLLSFDVGITVPFPVGEPFCP